MTTGHMPQITPRMVELVQAAIARLQAAKKPLTCYGIYSELYDVYQEGNVPDHEQNLNGAEIGAVCDQLQITLEEEAR